MSPSAGISVRADTAEFQRLFDRSSQVEAKLKTALRKNIRVAGESSADQARLAVMNAPGQTQGKQPRHSGLRLAIASGIRVKVMTGARAGVTIVASSAQMPAGKETLVRAWEGAKGWRHPVFGNTEVWRPQLGAPYFRRTIAGRREVVRAAVEAAMAEAARSLEG